MYCYGLSKLVVFNSIFNFPITVFFTKVLIGRGNETLQLPKPKSFPRLPRAHGPSKNARYAIWTCLYGVIIVKHVPVYLVYFY